MPSLSRPPTSPPAPKRTLKQDSRRGEGERNIKTAIQLRSPICDKGAKEEGGTIEVREEAGVDKSGSLGSAVAVVDADVGCGGRSENLTLVLQRVVGLDDGKGEIAGGVGLEVHVPDEAVSATEPTETPLQRAEALTQHHGGAAAKEELAAAEAEVAKNREASSPQRQSCSTVR